MAAKKYLQLGTDGFPEEKQGTASSAGVGNGGDLVALLDTGTLDPSVMPPGFGADAKNLPAFEDLVAGDMVNIFDDAGTAKARLADASTSGKIAEGYVLAAFDAGDTALVYFGRINNQLSGLTIGAKYFLSASSAGKITTTVPTGAGNVVQYVGKAISATELEFEPGTPIKRA